MGKHVKKCKHLLVGRTCFACRKPIKSNQFGLSIPGGFVHMACYDPVEL